MPVERYKQFKKCAEDTVPAMERRLDVFEKTLENVIEQTKKEAEKARQLVTEEAVKLKEELEVAEEKAEKLKKELELVTTEAKEAKDALKVAEEKATCAPDLEEQVDKRVAQKVKELVDQAKEDLESAVKSICKEQFNTCIGASADLLNAQQEQISQLQAEIDDMKKKPSGEGPLRIDVDSEENDRIAEIGQGLTATGEQIQQMANAAQEDEARSSRGKVQQHANKALASIQDTDQHGKDTLYNIFNIYSKDCATTVLQKEICLTRLAATIKASVLDAETSKLVLQWLEHYASEKSP